MRAQPGNVYSMHVFITLTIHTQRRYRYPSIFIIYQTIPSIILAVLVLVGFSARRKLFCRSQDLQESIKTPTPFCTLTGKEEFVCMLTIAVYYHYYA